MEANFGRTLRAHINHGTQLQRFEVPLVSKDTKIERASAQHSIDHTAGHAYF